MRSCTQSKQANIYNLQWMPLTISGLSLSRSTESVQRPFAICSLVKNRDNSFWASFWAVICNSFAVTSFWVTIPGIHFLILGTLMSPKKQPWPAWYTHTHTHAQKMFKFRLYFLMKPGCILPCGLFTVGDNGCGVIRSGTLLSSLSYGRRSSGVYG